MWIGPKIMVKRHILLKDHHHMLDWCRCAAITCKGGAGRQQSNRRGGHRRQYLRKTMMHRVLLGFAQSSHQMWTSRTGHIRQARWESACGSRFKLPVLAPDEHAVNTVLLRSKPCKIAHRTFWSVEVLFILSFEGPPLLRLKKR